MNGKKSFILYCDLIHTVRHLTDDKAGELFKHILMYVNDENPITDDVLINLAFEPVKQQLKRDLKKWEGIKVKRSDAGKASAKKRQQKSTKSTSVKFVEQKATNPTVNVSVNVNDNVKNVNNEINIGFDTFWNLYDKKIGDKIKLQKKWNKLKDSDREEIIKYIPKYISSIPDKKFRKNPETFLNNNSWNDELINGPELKIIEV